MSLDSVGKYILLLNGLITTDEGIKTVVKTIRQKKTDAEAVEFFVKITKPPQIGLHALWNLHEHPETVRKLQDFIRDIGLEVPAPDKLVQRWLDGGKYPIKKK